MTIQDLNKQFDNEYGISYDDIAWEYVPLRAMLYIEFLQEKLLKRKK